MTASNSILITGAAGNIGSKLRAHLSRQYILKLIDIENRQDSGIQQADLSQWSDQLVALFRDVETVIHLAADPYDYKSWEELTPWNLDALNNVFVAAIEARVPRVIFASSNHVMGGYKSEPGTGAWLNADLPPRPGTRYEMPAGSPRDSTAYGAMKLFGERLGKCYAHAASAVCIAVRIGMVNRYSENKIEGLSEDLDPWFKRMWLSTPDLCQLVEKAISVPLPPKTFMVINGMSDNKNMVWDIENARMVLGYSPKDGVTA